MRQTMRRTIFIAKRLATALTIEAAPATTHWPIAIHSPLPITATTGGEGTSWNGHMSGMLTGVGMVMAAWAMSDMGSVSADSTELSQESRFSKWWDSLTVTSPESRKRTFFKYEKRIRSLSTPEKIFEYFSSVEKDGVRYMTAVDMLRALVPVYPPEGSDMIRGGALLGERAPKMELTTVFKVFDMDGDNLISFYEYLMVLTLLSIPLRHIEVVFDIVDADDNGVVDKTEFEMVLNHIKKQSRQTNLSRGGLRTGLKAGQNSEDAGLLVKFFGEDGKEKLRLPKFKAFLEDLQMKLLMLEFMHYDFHNKQTIGGKDFARSLCAAADISTIDQYLMQVDAIDDKMAMYEITREEFLAFYSMVNHIHVVETALNFIESTDGSVSPDRFRKTIGKLAGIPLRSSLIDIIFWLFGDAQGRLKTREFINVLRARCRKQMPET